MNRTMDLLWLAIRKYFKHPAENLRQASPIQPGRLYENFGYICKAVPYTKDELQAVNNDKRDDSPGLDEEMLLEIVKSKGLRDKAGIAALQRDALEASSTPASCRFCDLARYHLPCPLYNTLKDGTTVCDTHKYVILKTPKI